jgi:thiol-disulfide isomerase/thioredoxin
MPLTRRVAARAVLATGGTLVGALAARKWLAPHPDEALTPAPHELQTLAGLQTVQPPARLPAYHWQSIDAQGAAHPHALSDYAGSGVVLNIWATWCGPCTREMPSLAHLARALQPAGIAVLPVSIDRSGAASVRSFFAQHAIDGLPVLTDSNAEAMTSLGIGAIPVTLLIGPHGMVHARLDGGADWSGPIAAETVRRLIGS